VGLLTVGEMARRSGVPATTLRYYDGLGLLVPVRLANGHRRYPDDSVARLQMIRLCQALGCDLDEIRELVRENTTEARRTAARRQLGNIDRQFQRLGVARTLLTHILECRCPTESECQALTQRALGELAEVGF
jgi:DNA-binding transcriptional MerR regulator